MRRVARGALAATAATAATAVVVGGGWSTIGWSRTPARPLPPTDASVRDVAAVYLDAAVHHDCATTQALTTGRTLAWCTSPTMTSYRDVTEPTLLEQTGRILQCVSFTMTNTESDDHSLNASTRPWSLCFARTAAGWRVADQGFL